jgi:putative hydrolase of the HAD superfamily
MLRYLIFDLDETLYPPQSGLWPAIGERINLYMAERLGLSLEQASELRARYAKEYGVTLAGLMKEHHVDPADYLEYVHDLPLARYLQPDAALNGMLARLPLPKAVLTNASAAHAERVLNQLGIARHFTHIVDIHALNFVNKPEPGAYARTLEILGAGPQECLFVDDLPRNLQPAHALGFITVLARESANGALPEGVDYQIPNILGLERIVAGLIGQA